jgi:hypothetical protein
MRTVFIATTLQTVKTIVFILKNQKIYGSMDADISPISLFYVLTCNSVKSYMMETMFWTQELIASQRVLVYWCIALLEGIFLRYVRYWCKKQKAIQLQAWTGPEGSRRLRLSDFKTIGT